MTKSTPTKTTTTVLSPSSTKPTPTTTNYSCSIITYSINRFNYNGIIALVRRAGFPLLAFFAFSRVIYYQKNHPETMENEYTTISDKITYSFLLNTQQPQQQQPTNQFLLPTANKSPQPKDEVESPSTKRVVVSKTKEEQITLLASNDSEMRSTRTITTKDPSWPSLETLIDTSGNIIANDVSFILDFAIMGFPKCGTSTMMHWLANHTSEIQCFTKEHRDLLHGKPHELIENFYAQFQHGAQYKRGYKNPVDINVVHILEYMRSMFYKTKIIIGIRHPVLWFESMYNFRVQNMGGKTSMPETSKLIGGCYKGSKNCCTNRANYAHALIRLGKQYLPMNQYTYSNQQYTQRTEPIELEEEIVRKDPSWEYDLMDINPVPNHVFIFDMNQLKDKNTTRIDQFRKDVATFLNLKYPLGPLPHYKPGKTYSPEVQQRIDALKINICDDEHIPVRADLMKSGPKSSEWIRAVFLNSPSVHVSSKEYFISLLEDYLVDPCDN